MVELWNYTINMQPWASSDYAGAGCLSFLSRPLRVDSPLTRRDCVALADLLEGLMFELREEGPWAPSFRATRNGLSARLLAARTHCDLTFGSVEESRLRCDLHVLLGEVAHCAGFSRGVLVWSCGEYLRNHAARVQEQGHGGECLP